MTQTPAGWYPAGDGTQRYWDGETWTEDTAPVDGLARPEWRPETYLEGAPSGFQDAIRNAVKHAFVFKGRASRSSFWWYQLVAFAMVVSYFVVVTVVDSYSRTAANVVNAVLLVGLLGVVVVGISLGVRRLHDRGMSGWWYLLILFGLGQIVLLVIFVFPGAREPNKYNSVAAGGQTADLPVKP